jgi:hypothetical protein
MADEKWLERFHRAYYFGKRWGPVVFYGDAIWVIPKGYVPPERWRPRGVLQCAAVMAELS